MNDKNLANDLPTCSPEFLAHLKNVIEQNPVQLTTEGIEWLHHVLDNMTPEEREAFKARFEAKTKRAKPLILDEFPQWSPEVLAYLKQLREQSLIKAGEPAIGQCFDGDSNEDQLGRLSAEGIRVIYDENVELTPVTGQPGHYFAFSKPRKGKSFVEPGHTLIIGQTGAGKTGPIKPEDISPQGHFIFDGENLLDADDIADDVIDQIQAYRLSGKTHELMKIARYLQSLCDETPKDEGSCEVLNCIECQKKDEGSN